MHLPNIWLRQAIAAPLGHSLVQGRAQVSVPGRAATRHPPSPSAPRPASGQRRLHRAAPRGPHSLRRASGPRQGQAPALFRDVVTPRAPATDRQALTFHRSPFVRVGVTFSLPLDPPDNPSILKQVLAFEVKQLNLKKKGGQSLRREKGVEKNNRKATKWHFILPLESQAS